MTREEIETSFDELRYTNGKMANKLSQWEVIQKYGPISNASHDIVWLTKLPKTEWDIAVLIKSGVHYDGDNECLAMFV